MITPYPEQVESAKKAAKLGRGTIVMPTGCGKSVAMALLINELQVKTLVIVPNLQLKQQLRQSFNNFFGGLQNITVENIDSGRLPTLTDYDCLIIDEAHHVAARTYRKLNKKSWNGIYYRYFFTATPFRSREEEQLLYESIAGQVIYRIDHATAVAKGYIVPIEAYYVDLPKREVEGHTWAQVYKELVTDNKDRNAVIRALLATLACNAKSTLCLVKEIKHGETLSNPIYSAFASGVEELTRQYILEFNLRQRPVLIGTTGILGEGVDTKPCEYVIIAGLGKSKNAFMQQAGRSFRTYPGKESAKIIIFKDASHKWTLAHFKTQCKILLDEYGVKPVRLEV